MEFITKYGRRVGVCALLEKRARFQFGENDFPSTQPNQRKEDIFLVLYS